MGLVRALLRGMLLAASASACGCAVFGSATAGYGHAFAQAPERSTFTTNVYAGYGPGTGEPGGTGLGFGDAVGLRTKWSDAVQQVSISDSLFFLYGFGLDGSGNPAIGLFANAGAALFTFEEVAGESSASLASPFAELGTFFRVLDEWGITASVGIEDDIRFTDLPSTGYLTFALGVGVMSFVELDLRRPPPGARHAYTGDRR